MKKYGQKFTRTTADVAQLLWMRHNYADKAQLCRQGTTTGNEALALTNAQTPASDSQQAAQLSSIITIRTYTLGRITKKPQ